MFIMKVSDYYELKSKQPSLDFVDVKIDEDTPLFIDPTALSLLDSEWGARCRSLIQDYFSHVLGNIKLGNHSRARQLMSVLGEPNETRLGYSSGEPRGHGMGKGLAEKMWEGLKESSAVRSGIIEDLEDTALMIDGVSSDIISDIVTNIIREPLLEYTLEMSRLYDISVEAVASQPIWNTQEKKWETKFVDQPIPAEKPLLLVPKALVRKTITYQADNYYNLYLLERLQEEEVSQGFVQLLKNGKSKPPTKKSLKEKYGNPGKEPNRKLTPGREDVLQKYKQDKKESPRPALSHEKIAETTNTPEPDWEMMLRKLGDLDTGTQNATAYEKVIKDLLTAIFYPWLMYPELQHRINEGRKIIDITFMNMAQDDFFWWLSNNYSAPYITIECKNYSTDPNNPELDQLSGRFSPRRGRFGLLVCRKIENKKLFEQKCKDTANDDRGFIVGLDDDDISKLVSSVRLGKKGDTLKLLQDKFEKLVM